MNLFVLFKKSLNKTPFLLALFFFLNIPGQAQPLYPFVLDGNYSESIGAYNLLTLHRALYGWENKILKLKWGEENSWDKKALGLTYRLGKTFLLDNVLDHQTFLIQHEIFGHGARYREFGYRDNQYGLNLVFPFGNSSGWAARGNLSSKRRISFHENLTMILGGSESNILLSDFLRYKWLQRNSINHRETILYLITANDLIQYIWRTHFQWRSSQRNDVLSYLREVNQHSGYLYPQNAKLRTEDLSRCALANLFNPFQYFSLYTYMVTYLWKGQQSQTFPMISLGKWNYLPSFRIGLTPFGPEIYTENFMVRSEKIFNFYFRYGIPTFHKFWGLGMKAVNLIQNSAISIHVHLDLWNQPSLFLGEKEQIRKSHSGWGGALRSTLLYDVNFQDWSFKAMVQLGYKTDGYLLGERLASGFILRAGIAFLEV